MAERKGFEPLRRFPAYTLSRRAPSTTRPSLRIALFLGWKRQGAGWLAGASEAQYTYQRLGRKGSRRLDDDCFCRRRLPPCEQAALHGTNSCAWGGTDGAGGRLSP
jgi:hypothetical protein